MENEILNNQKLIITKLDECIKLLKMIHEDTTDSTSNLTREYLLNLLGDITGDIIVGK